MAAPPVLHKTLSDVWSTPRAEESQICVQGNLEADKKEFSVPRVCHVHFSHIELLDVHADEFMVAIGLLKGSNKRIRSPPIVFRSKMHTLNLTFSFQYWHHLKGPAEPNTLRVMLQQRTKKQHKTFAQALINLSDIMQSGRRELQLAVNLNGKNGEPVNAYAFLYGSIGTYTEDIETVEDAVEWEDYYNEPNSWSNVDADSEEASFSSSDETADMTEIGGIDNTKQPVLSEQLRGSAIHGAQTKLELPKDDKKDGHSPANRRGKIAKVSKLFSAVSHSRSISTSKTPDSEDNVFNQPEVEMFETNYPDEELRNDSDNEAESDEGFLKHSKVTARKSIKLFDERNESEVPLVENLYVFIKTSKKRGQKLESLAKSSGGILHNYIPILSSTDVEELMLQILTKYENSREATSEEPRKLKIMLAGNDSFVNSFVRVFVDLLSKKSRAWYIDHLRFLLIPVGVNVDIARQIASVDSLYRSLFFCPEWEHFFDNYSEPFSAETGNNLLHKIEKYVLDSKDLQKFELGEAFITQVSQNKQEMVKVPFIKSIKIGSINLAIMNEDTKEKRKDQENESPSLPEVELQVDYWVSKKKGETQVSVKGMFNLVGITRLPGMCNVWRIDPQYRPNSNNFAMLLQYRDKKRGFVKATVAKAGMKLESHSRPQSTQSKITKLTCSLPAESQEPLKVNIDGTEWKGVKFISISPQWGTHVKSFPVCIFDSNTV